MAAGSVSTALPVGVDVISGCFDEAEQNDLMAEIRSLAEAAPFFTPRMPKTDRPFSVAMTNAGPLGWVSDAAGYRYQPTHPVTGAPWPAIPQPLLDLWRDVTDGGATPEACLVNLYRGTAKLGSHVDRDEETFDFPVVSVSLGDTAVFHVGGRRRSDPKVRITLRSGDVVVLGGESRLAYHGIDKVMAGTSDLVDFGDGITGGRINLTLRRVTVAS